MNVTFRFYSTCQRVKRASLLAPAALALLLALTTESSARSEYLTGQEIPSKVSSVNSLYVPEEGRTNVDMVGADGKEPQGKKTIFMNSSTAHTANLPVSAAETAPKQSTGRVPDWDGIKRDAGIIVGAQFAAVAITYVMPESFSSWTPEQKKAGFDKYKSNFVHPVMDKDEFYINYILHPYWGSTYYTRARERGLDKGTSFGYSVLMSAVYEFGVECIAEKPSIQDLIITPVIGSLMGALIEPWRDSIKGKKELLWYDHTALILTDPLGVVSLGFEKLFGIKSTIVVNYSAPKNQNTAVGTSPVSNNARIGVALQFPTN